MDGIPDIPDLPDAPDPADPPQVFAREAYLFTRALPAWGAALQGLGQYIRDAELNLDAISRHDYEEHFDLPLGTTEITTALGASSASELDVYRNGVLLHAAGFQAPSTVLLPAPSEANDEYVLVRRTGARGDRGPAGSIAVGTVTTLSTGEPATVENVGTPEEAVLNFGVPTGPQGPAATVAVGTVTTVGSGQPAAVTNSGTSEEAVLDFDIPMGPAVPLSDANPQPLGATAAPGDASDAARANHVHPRPTPAEIGAEVAGAAAAGDAAHVAASNPHPQYTRRSASLAAPVMQSNSSADMSVLSLVVPGGTLAAGSVYEFEVWGYHSTPSLTNPTLTGKLKLNGSTAASIGIAVGTAAWTNRAIRMRGALVCETAGASGAINVAMELMIDTANDDTHRVTVPTAAIAIDTTAAVTINLAIANSVVNANVSQTARIATIRETHRP